MLRPFEETILPIITSRWRASVAMRLRVVASFRLEFNFCRRLSVDLWRASPVNFSLPIASYFGLQIFFVQIACLPAGHRYRHASDRHLDRSITHIFCYFFTLSYSHYLLVIFIFNKTIFRKLAKKQPTACIIYENYSLYMMIIIIY